MKLKKRLSLFLVLTLFVSACNSIYQMKPTITESPIDSLSPLETNTTIPSKTTVWKAWPSAEVDYDPDLWALQSDSNVPSELPYSLSLMSLNISECSLELNRGTEYPEEWTVIREDITLGEFPTQKARFVDENNKMRFIIYYYGFVDFYIGPGENWQACAAEAEKVLATIRNLKE